MRCCASIPDRGWQRTAVLALLLTACAGPDSDFGFTLEQAEVHRSGSTLEVRIQQKIVFSTEAKKALNHGVPLFIRTELSLRSNPSGQEVSSASQEFEIRYLPLSKRYELLTEEPKSARSFPRLRHLLAEISVLNFKLAVAELPGDSIELSARTFLDRRNMPPPLRLPSRFSAQWRHDSGWKSWPLALGDNA